MSIARPSTLTRAWLALLAITIVSFIAAEYLDWRTVAIAAIMGIAAIKVGMILRWFMALEEAPMGIRAYMAEWTLACALLIFGLWRYAAA